MEDDLFNQLFVTIPIYPPSSCVLEKLQVKEGDVVLVGQQIAELYIAGLYSQSLLSPFNGIVHSVLNEGKNYVAEFVLYFINSFN